MLIIKREQVGFSGRTNKYSE